MEEVKMVKLPFGDTNEAEKLLQSYYDKGWKLQDMSNGVAILARPKKDGPQPLLEG